MTAGLIITSYAALLPVCSPELTYALVSTCVITSSYPCAGSLPNDSHWETPLSSVTGPRAAAAPPRASSLHARAADVVAGSAPASLFVMPQEAQLRRRPSWTLPPRTRRPPSAWLATGGLLPLRYG